MRVLLISTYNVFFTGLRSIGAYLEKHGHTVFYEHLKTPTNSSIKKMADCIKPDIIGFTCLTAGARKVIRYAEIFKQLLPDSTVVLGNIHATLYYDQILSNFPLIDYVILEEGELPMKDLIEHLSGKIPLVEVPGIAFRNEKGCVVRNRKPESLPDINDISNKPGKWNLKGNSIRIVTSRGCPYNCDYCTERMISRQKWRPLTAEKSVDIIEYWHKRYNIKRFNIDDVIFTIDKNRVKEICMEINKRKLQITWVCQTHPKHIDKELLYYMKKAGCIAVCIGLDCATNSLMYKYRRFKVNYSRIQELIRNARGLDILIVINLIFCYPDSSLIADLKHLLCIIRKLKPAAIGINPLRLYPGTRIYEEAVKKGIISNDYWLDKRNPEVYSGNYMRTKSKLCINLIEFVFISAIFLTQFSYRIEIKGLLFEIIKITRNTTATIVSDLKTFISKLNI
ncbi:B12-binding domain-containing radical SAM protein [Elusimicrobiota bacterium]